MRSTLPVSRAILWALIALPVVILGHLASAVPFTPGNLAVYRVGVAGDGTDPISGGETVFIDEYEIDGTPVQSFQMPTSTIGNQRKLVAHGTSTAEGFINRSPDGQWLTFAGYDAPLGTPGLSSSSASTTASPPGFNRVIARMDAAGNLDTSTGLNNWSGGGSPRSVITTNGTKFRMVGANGNLREANLGDTASVLYSSQILVPRHIDVFDGHMFISTGSGNASVTSSVAEVNQVTGAAMYLTGVPAPSGIDVYQFYMADLSTTETGIDTLYVADTQSAAAGGLRKYSLVSGAWVANGGVIGAPLGQFRGLTGEVSGSSVNLYGVNSGGLYAFVDSSGHNGAFNGTASLLASAPANTLFKGVDFTPVAPSTGPDGDLDGDDDTDGNDFLLWQRGQSPNPLSAGDLADWEAGFGTATVAARPVPEPSAVALVGLAAAGLMLASRRKSSR
jgi:hypothetical protein